MKRLLAVVLLACLAAACFSAAAETTRKFDDFSITADDGAIIEAGEKKNGAILCTVYPYAGSGDSATNFNVLWGDEKNLVFQLNEFLEGQRQNEESVRNGYKQVGIELKSYEVTGAAEEVLWEQYAVRCDIYTTLASGDREKDVIQRVYLLSGDYGTYVITLSADTEANIRKMAGELPKLIQWKY